MADLVRGEIGASVQQTTPAQATIYVRGLSGREVVHLVDGIRVNTTIFRVGNNPHLALIDPLSLERVVLVRGSSAVLRGSDALGGVVAMFTPLTPLSDEPRLQVRSSAGATANPWGMQHAAHVAYTTPHVGLDVSAGMTARGDIVPGGGSRSPDPRSYPGATRAADGAYAPRLVRAQIGTGFSRAWAASAFRIAVSPRTEIVLRGQASVVPDLERYDEIVPRFKRALPARGASTTAPFTRWMGSASVLRRGETTVSWVSGVQRITERVERRNLGESCTTGEDEVADCQGAVRLSPSPRSSSEINAMLLLSSRVEATRKVTRALHGVAGAEIIHERVASASSSRVAGSDEVRQDASRYPDGSMQTQIGGFARAGYTIGRSQLGAGARLSAFLLDIASRPPPDAAPGFPSVVLGVSPELGARFRATPSVSIAANASRGVRAPNVQDFAALGARAGGRYQLPARDVRPEKTTSLDVGIEARLAWLRLQAFAFGMRYDDAIVLVPTTLAGQSENDAGEAYVISQNASRVDLLGAEGGVSADVGARTTIFGTGLLMRGTQHNPPGADGPTTTPADRVPPPQATLGARLKVSLRWEIQAFARGRLAQRRLNDPVNLDDNRIPEGGTDGYVTLHGRARCELGAGWEGAAAVDNLTNTLALEHGSGFYLPGIGGSLSLRYTSEWRRCFETLAQEPRGAVALPVGRSERQNAHGDRRSGRSPGRCDATDAAREPRGRSNSETTGVPAFSALRSRAAWRPMRRRPRRVIVCFLLGFASHS